jgi:VWFA-related protein
VSISLRRGAARPARPARTAGGLIVAAALGSASVLTFARQADDPSQTFRTAVDVIRIDATVLDKDRRPIRGLTAADFTVLENGKPQRIVAVQEIDTVANDPVPSAWMRYAPRDVIGNDLSDQLSDGQALAIVMDDDHIPFDDTDIIVATRNLARYIINSLRPSDMAAVIFPVRAGETQDFTTDRSKLLATIDAFAPQEENTLAEAYRVVPPAGPLEGDIQRYSPIIGRDPCLLNEPVLPTLRTTTARLSTIQNQRKTVIFLSTGAPVRFMPGTGCQGVLYDEMRATFRQAQRYNVNIHAIDPAGARGMENYYTQPHMREGRLRMPLDNFRARQTSVRMHDFLKLNAEQTGGRAAIDSVDPESEVDQIFTENSAYYLIGYESSTGSPDGRFRRVEIKVRAPNATVHAKNGYWAPDKDDPNLKHDQSPAHELRLSNLASPVGLPLRVAVHPVALLPNGDVDVASVLTVRVPAPRERLDDSLTLIRTVIDLDGRAGRPDQQKLTRTIAPGAGDVVRYDVLSRFPLSPGRYEIRFNATSRFTDSSGSVYAEIEVPDLRKSPIAVPGIALGYLTDEPRADDVASVMDMVPTTSRDFTRNDRVRALVRVFQGGDAPVAPVSIAARVLGADDVEPVTVDETIDAARFEPARAADYQLDLPFDRLEPGLHLLSITASLPQGRSVRRDVVFKLR